MAELRALLARADEMMAPFSCAGQTECCRFGLTGREPYLTRLEEEALRRALAARPAPKRKLVVLGEERCTFLDETGRCTVYASRPLGCRTFFCDARQGPRSFPRAEVNRLALELAELSRRHFPQHREVRPMRRVFA